MSTLTSPAPALPSSGWLLSFDASSPTLVVTLGRFEDGRAEPEPRGGSVLPDAGRSASTELVPRVQALCDEVGISLQELAVLACGRGPGTFTGTRVAVATCKGLAFGLGLPVLPVSTLAALAASSDVSGQVFALLDARKGEVYGAAFDVGRTQNAVDLSLRVDDCCLSPGDFFAQVDTNSGTVLGPGAARYRDQLPTTLTHNESFADGPSYRGLWRASASALHLGEAITGAELQASYLRASYAEIGVHQPKTPRYVSPFLDS